MIRSFLTLRLVFSFNSECIFEIRVGVSSLFHDFRTVVLLLFFEVALLLELREFLGARLAWRNEFRVLPQSLSSHTPIKRLNRVEAEPWPNLNEDHLVDVVVRGELFLLLIEDLVVAEPDALVQEVE